MSKQFAAMEEAALKAYQEDLKRMEREAAGNRFIFCNVILVREAFALWL